MPDGGGFPPVFRPPSLVSPSLLRLYPEKNASFVRNLSVECRSAIVSVTSTTPAYEIGDPAESR
jgi:hypothetical protein